jgi:beta-glucosidase
MNIEKLLEQLTIEEKCLLLVGQGPWHTAPIERLNIPSIMMTDGPHGVRKEYEAENSIAFIDSYPSVCFPPAVTLASSFDPQLASEMGKALARECLSKDVSLLLGPGMNIKRSPLCGRNFEYFSEDPKVTAEIAKGFVKGVESQGVGACPKHFAFNNQETLRMTSSSELDRRTKFEIYLRAFKEVVKENPSMIMCSYNKVDNIFASENKELLDTILRKRFGFENVIVSDWRAVSNRANALKATLDLEMPENSYSVQKLINSVASGEISIDEVNQSVARILKMVEKYQFKEKTDTDVKVLDENHKVAKKIAKESMVLLKNDSDILPLKKTDSIALIGRLAKEPRYQGGGSSHMNPYIVNDLIECFSDDIDFGYAEGYRLTGDGYDKELIALAVKLAKTKSKVIAIIGLTDEYESEGYDRTNLELPKGHNELIKALSEVNKNIIVVLQMGSPVTMPWINDVKAVLNAYLGGEAGALATIDLLYGKENPSGRLAETFPLHLEDNPIHKIYANQNEDVFYQESVYVGYRFYQSMDVKVLFPFGYGLSYSKFEYSDFTVDKTKIGGTEKVKVSVKVKNNSTLAGKEVVQLYIENHTLGIYRPLRELRAFQKVFILGNDEKTVEFTLTIKDFDYFNPADNAFVTPEGSYQIQICKSALDIIFSSPIDITKGTEVNASNAYIDAKSYFIKNSVQFDSKEFESLLGHPVSMVNHKNRPYSLDNTLSDIEKTLIGKILKNQILKQMYKELQGMPSDYIQMVEKSLYETPLRSIVAYSGGIIKMRFMLGIIEIANHHFLKAIRCFLKEKTL